MRNRTFALITLSIIAIYSIYLHLTQKLGYYIHPRFFEESLLAGIVGSFAVISYTVILVRKKKSFHFDEIILIFFFLTGIFINLLFLGIGLLFVLKQNKSLKVSISNFFILCFLVLMVINPPASLSSFTASQRASDLTSLNISNQTRLLVNSFSTNTKNLALSDWIASFTYNPDKEFYIDKEVRVTGFMFRTDDITNSDFIVSRFVVSCCAVDARPVGIKVQGSNLVEFKKDQWIEVEGKFAEIKDEIIIIPTRVIYISQPEKPYIY